jgi:hypothetical protein
MYVHLVVQALHSVDQLCCVLSALLQVSKTDLPRAKNTAADQVCSIALTAAHMSAALRTACEQCAMSRVQRSGQCFTKSCVH